MSEWLNFVSGKWVAGERVVESRSRSDPGDVVGLYAQAVLGQLHEAA